jgi:chromosome segregation ATPase
MPLLNTKNSRISTQNQSMNELAPLNKQIKNLNNSIIKTTGELNRIKSDLNSFTEMKIKLDTFISYNDKGRLNSVVKDLTLLKKQINMSRTSKVMKNLQELKEKINNIENHLEEEAERKEEEAAKYADWQLGDGEEETIKEED